MSDCEKLVALLKERGMTVAFAESCTGGMISSSLVDVPGASDVFGFGFVTYANEAKMKMIGVSEETLRAYGAVSHQTAEEMAAGAAHVSGADLAVSVTGVAGPDGGTPEKPVGLVYIGLCLCGDVTSFENHFSGSRSEIRKQSAQRAVALAKEALALQ